MHNMLKGAVTLVSSALMLLACHHTTLCSALSSMASQRLARIRVSKTVEQPVVVTPMPVKHEGAEGGTKTVHCCPLDRYMQLPAAQYACVPMPMNASLTRLRGEEDRFMLCVPPMIFRVPGLSSVEVVPEVVARVTVKEDRVLIVSNDCTIRGSPVIESLLKDCFDFRVRSCLTWTSKSCKAGKVAVAEDVKPRIRVNSTIEVDVDPPGPFKPIPRRILEVIGNTAFSFTLGSLLGQFMKSLAADFERWSTDGAYRRKRRQMEVDLVSELSSKVQLIGH